jgi:hypothetical protein
MKPRKCLHVCLALLAIGSCLAFTACGGGVQAGTTNGAVGALAFGASPVNFGSVALGGSKKATVPVQNTGPATGPSITVSQVAAGGAGFTATPSTPLPVTLQGGQSFNVVVSFAPQSAGTATGTLSVVAMGSNPPTSMPLSGAGLAASQLAVSSSTMSFGSVAVGGSQSLNANLTAGSSNVTVSSASWSGGGFALSGITFPVTVSAGQSVPFTVTFAPQAAGSSTGQVSFVSDATNSPALVSLSGTGTQPSHSVNLLWNPSSSSVSGYNIYRGTASGGPYLKLTSAPTSSLAFTDTSVQSGMTYYYVATAVDLNNTESGYSNLATAVIP